MNRYFGLRHFKKIVRTRSQRGSAIIQAMVTVAVLSVVGLTITNLNNQMSSEGKQVRITNDVDGVVSLMRAMTADPDVCAQTLIFATNGASPNETVMSSAPGQGMLMCLPTGGVDTAGDGRLMAPPPPNPGSGSFGRPCDYKGGGTNSATGDWFPQENNINNATYSPTAKPFNADGLTGAPYDTRPKLNVDVEWIRFTLTAPVVDANPLFTYRGSLVAKLSSNEAGARSKNVRTIIEDLEITYDSGEGQIVSCNPKGTSQQLCRDMGCSWDAAQNPRCICGYTPAACPNGQAIMGVNVDGSLICSSVASQCPSGQVAVGYVNMNLVCEPQGQWLVSAWSVCSGGTHTRNVDCIHNMTGAILTNPAFCPAPAPVDTEACGAAAAPTVNLWVSGYADGATVSTTSTITLNWTSSNAVSCTATGGWSGAKTITGTQSGVSGSVGSSTYTITCTSSSGTTAAASVTINWANNGPWSGLGCASCPSGTQTHSYVLGTNVFCSFPDTASGGSYGVGQPGPFSALYEGSGAGPWVSASQIIPNVPATSSINAGPMCEYLGADHAWQIRAK